VSCCSSWSPSSALTLAFAWWFRASNQTGYLPAGLELQRQGRVLDLDHPAADRPLPGGGGLGQLARTRSVQAAAASPNKRVRVEVVAMDWKWLFIYPELGVASVNELALPSIRP
jgi:cytochrome o ubiquinol oxidase subunit 2